MIVEDNYIKFALIYFMINKTYKVPKKSISTEEIFYNADFNDIFQFNR